MNVVLIAMPAKVHVVYAISINTEVNPFSFPLPSPLLGLPLQQQHSL